jgi:hypothetical protein
MSASHLAGDLRHDGDLLEQLDGHQCGLHHGLYAGQRRQQRRGWRFPYNFPFNSEKNNSHLKISAVGMKKYFVGSENVRIFAARKK